MVNKKFVIVIVIMFLLMAGCGTTFEVTERDPNGYFPADGEARVVTSKSFDLDTRRDLVVIGDLDFFDGQMESIGYFREIMRIPELETAIVRADLADKVPGIQDRIGLNNAAKHYRPFIWFRADSRKEGNRSYAQFILTDALTLEDIFVVESYLDTVWTGVSDRRNFYPMFNALIDYIEANSETYER